MKVLFVSHERHRKGSSVSMLTTIQFLMEVYGWQIDVLLPYYGLVHRILRERNVPHRILFYFSNYRKLGRGLKLSEQIKECANSVAEFRLRRILEKENYDCVISNSTAVDIGARACLKLGIKHIYYVREYMEENYSEYRNKERMKLLLEASNKVIFISQAIANKYNSIYKIKDYRVIYNGVAKDDYYIKSHQILKDSTIQLIQIGEFCDGKGTKETIKYFINLKRSVKCHLTLVGHSKKKYLEDIHGIIRDNHLENDITILSYTDDIKLLIKKADVLLTNSRFEGFGRTTVEGMLGGLLAFGRDTGGTGEIILNNKTGLLFHSENEFIEKMIEVDRERIKYRKIALEGQKYALENFSMDKNAEGVKEYLEEA